MDQENDNILFRDLIADNRLLKLLDAVEGYLGYIIKTDQISIEHKKNAVMSMHLSEDGKFLLLYDRNEEINQAVLCHELMHMVLWIEGWPVLCVDESWMHLPVQKEIMDKISNLVLHLEVWPLVEKYGFDETGLYNSDVLVESLKKDVPPQWMEPGMALAVSGVSIAQGLLQPEPQGVKDEIRQIAAQRIPRSLAVADSIVDVLQAHRPLSQYGCLVAFEAVLETIQAPKGIQRPIYINTPCPGFRHQFFPASHKDPLTDIQ